jgi:hypothetical protein
MTDARLDLERLFPLTCRIDPPADDWLNDDGIDSLLSPHTMLFEVGAWDVFEALDVDQQADIRHGRCDADLMRTLARALRDRRMRQQGKPPPDYLQPVTCARCGPVWLWRDAPQNMQGCPWCINRRAGLPIPRPVDVRCLECRRFTAGPINPMSALGRCTRNRSGSTWPRAQACGHWLPRSDMTSPAKGEST